MEDILKKEHWLTIPFAPEFQVSENGNVRQTDNGQLVIPEAAHIILNISVPRLTASVWHSHLSGKAIPKNPEAELLFVDGNENNLNYDNLSFDELSESEINELDALNS